jgi:hypothetical protein
MDSICPTIAVGSIGEVGSWVLSCVIKSCKNKSLELLASGSELALELVELVVEPDCDVPGVWSKGSAT